MSERSLLSFGDCVLIDGREFVFLAATEELTYLAWILKPEESDKIVRQSERVFSSGSLAAVRKRRHPLYCFVTLTTERFRSRIAHLGFNLAQDIDRLSSPAPVVRLNDADVQSLQREITDDASPIPPELKQIIRKLN